MRRGRNQPDTRSGKTNRGYFLTYLRTRQFSALTRFRPLRHFDFDLLGMDKVIDRHAKPPAGDLLHRAFPLGAKALDLLASFPTASFTTDSIHSDGQRLVRLGAQRAMRHGACRKTLPDLFNGFYFVDWDGLVLIDIEIEEAANGLKPLILIVQIVGKIAVGFIIPGPYRKLQLADRRRIPLVQLAIPAPIKVSSDVQRKIANDLVTKCQFVLLEHFTLHLF